MVRERSGSAAKTQVKKRRQSVASIQETGSKSIKRSYATAGGDDKENWPESRNSCRSQSRSFKRQHSFDK